MYESRYGFRGRLHVDGECVCFPAQRAGCNGDLVWTGQHIVETVFASVEGGRWELSTASSVSVQRIQSDWDFFTIATGIGQAFDFTDNGGA